MSALGDERFRSVLAVIVVIVMALTILPSMLSPSPVRDEQDSGILANGSRTLNVGIFNYLTSVATLNPFTYTMSAEYQTIWPCYSTLLTYDESTSLIGDLAQSWSVSPNGTVWNFKIATNAYFVDPVSPTSTAHQVTANDVFWTLWECQNDSGNHLNSYLNDGAQPIIKKMWTGANLFDIYLQTYGVYAPFLNALTVLPIVPKYIWTNLGHFTPLTYSNLPPIGSGSLYYDKGAALPGQTAILKRNPIWFQEANRGWQLHIDTLQYKSLSDVTMAWSYLTQSPPLIDVIQNVNPDDYLSKVLSGATPGVIGWATSTGFVYEYQLNQLTPMRRTQLENAGLMKRGGTNNPLMSDPTVKLALAMCVDKRAFIDTLLYGLGSVADSLVPDCNRWHYSYPDPIQFDPAAARALLNGAGWTYDSTGAYNPGATPLYKKGSSNGTVYHPLSFNIFTMNTGSEWQLGANLLVQWAAQAGAQFSLSLQSVNSANSLWYSGDYDAWLWDWVFSPTSDPSVDCLSVDTTMAIGTWSGSYWSNKTYDSLYNSSLTTTSDSSRRQFTDAMQALLYEDHNDQLIAYAKSLYAASTHNWDGASYGNWESHWTLTTDSGLPWLYMRLSPVDNLAPRVSVSSPGGYVGYPNSPITFSGTSSQTAGVLYQWYWGDGTASGWLSSPTTDHTYTTGGVFTVYFSARQTGTSDGFIGWNLTTAYIVTDNIPPFFGNPPITMVPSTGINTGTTIWFTAHVTDPNGDLIFYSWDFGDSHSALGAVVSHQYTSAGTGSYTVTLTVTDNLPGSPPQVATQIVPVSENLPPVVSIPSHKLVNKGVLTNFAATASDPDNDPLRFTWYWGDDHVSVTTTPFALHTYPIMGSYVLVLWVDDLTGLQGHNVSATEIVKVADTGPTPPTSVTLAVTPQSFYYVGQSLLFTGSAQDLGGDGMQFDFVFGDGAHTVVNNPPGAPNEVVTNSSAHIYTSPGTYSAYMSATDGLSTTSSNTISITLFLNHTPTLFPQTPKNANQGALVSFAATATDLDGDTLRYTWDFGDGSPLVVNRSTTHKYVLAGYYNFTVFVDDLTGIPGHNVSSRAQASIAFNLALVAGWNLVTVPVVGFGYKASTIGLATGDMIIAWNSSRHLYDPPYIKGISPPSADFPIVPGTGYWIWVTASKTLHLYGSAPTTLRTMTFTLPPSGGWLCIGLVSQKTTLHASNIPGMYSGTGAITLVARYDTISKTYKPWLAGVPFNDFLLVPGQAYMCWATGSGVLSYIP